MIRWDCDRLGRSGNEAGKSSSLEMADPAWSQVKRYKRQEVKRLRGERILSVLPRIVIYFCGKS